MVGNMLAQIFTPKDIENIQINKHKKWATSKIFANSPKSKQSIKNLLENENVPLYVNDQVWSGSLYKT